MWNKVKNNPYSYLIALMVLLGFGLRLLYHYCLGSYWFDEYFSVFFTQLPLNQMLGLFLTDVNLPLYQIILWFWVRIFNNTELAARMLSIIFAVLNIPLLYIFGTKLFSKKTAFIASLFYTLSTYQIFLTAEARGYSLLIFLSLLSCWFFWRLLEENTKKRIWFGYTLTTLLLAYAHPTGDLLILAQALYVIIKYWRQKRAWLSWLFSYLVIFLSALPYYVVYYLSKQDAVSGVYLEYISHDLNFFTWIFRNFFREANYYHYLEPFYVLLPVLALGSLIIIKKIKGEYDFGVKIKSCPAVNFCLLAIAVLLIGCFFFNWVTPRYLILAAVFTYLLIGQGVKNWFSGKKPLQFLLLIFIIILLVINYGNFFVENNDWSRINKCLQEMSGENSKIIVHNFAFEIMLKKYYSGNLPVEGFYPLTNDLTFEERIVRDNGRPIVTKENVGRLADSVRGYNNILLVEAIYVPVLDPDKKVIRWLVDNGWQPENKLCQVGRNRVYSFIKN